MKQSTLWITAIVVGLVVTGLTGMLNTTPNLVGATWYGAPVSWYTVPVVPNPPMNINWLALVMDVVFWAAISAYILALFRK